MKFSIGRMFLILGLSIFLCAETAQATPVGYTDYSSYMAALPGSASTLDFDSLSSGYIISDGDTIGGITFIYNFGSVQMMVSDAFDTTSPENFLGTDDANVFQDGDDFNLSFGPVNAIGMFFITADLMDDNDITLSAAGTSVGLSVADAGADVGDEGIPYFLGIIDDTNPFTTASIDTNGGGFFLYNVDDITTSLSASVPDVSVIWLLGPSLVGIAMFRRKIRK